MSTYIANPYGAGGTGLVKSSQWIAMTNSKSPKVYKNATNTVMKMYTINSTATTTNQMIVTQTGSNVYWMDDTGRSGTIRVEAGHPARIELPDGAIIDVKADGSYEIVDKDAKVTYKANRVREFNRYVNASDLLEEFIDFVDGVGGIDKERFLALPIETFIRWLVLRAAQADGETLVEEQTAIEQSVLALPAPSPKIKRNCKCCGRFVTRQRADNAMLFCSVEHFAHFEQKVATVR